MTDKKIDEAKQDLLATDEVWEPKPIIVGFTSRAREGWNEKLIEPEVPKSYASDPKKREPWLAKYFEAVTAAAPFCKLTGEITSIFAVDVHYERVYSQSAEGPIALASDFVRWLMRRYCFPAYPSDAPPASYCRVHFYGFDVSDFCRMLGVNAVREGLEGVPVGLWYKNTRVFDPKEMLLETDMKKVIGFEKIFDEAPGGPIEHPENYQPHRDAMTDAILAAELCARYQLFPAASSPQGLLQASAQGVGAAEAVEETDEL